MSNNRKVRKEQMPNYVANVVFADTDAAFRTWCDTAKVKPTRRQASKYRMKKGSAYNARNLK